MPLRKISNIFNWLSKKYVVGITDTILKQIKIDKKERFPRSSKWLGNRSLYLYQFLSLINHAHTGWTFVS